MSLAVYLPFVILFHHDYFYGGRGLFRAPRAAYDLGVQLERSAVFFAREPWLVALYAAGAVVALARGVRGWLAGVAAVAVVSALAGERFKDVPVQLTTTALASPLIAFVVSSLLSLAAVERRGALLVLSRVAAALAVLAVAAALFLTGRVALARTRALIRHSERFRAALLELARSFPDELTLVHSQGFGQSRTFERVLFGRTRNGRVMSRRDFETHCAAYASERHTFWIAQAPFDAPCPELEERYERTSRELYGSRFHLLVPNDRR